MRIITILSLVVLPCFTGLVIAQKHSAARQSASVAGEYREFNLHEKLSPWGGTTFNIERNKRTLKYSLWIGSMGATSDNYHDADATRLQVNDRTGALSFSYTNDGEQCSFSGTVKGGKMEGQLDCTDKGKRKSKHMILKK